jgi:hypothetical protein
MRKVKFTTLVACIGLSTLLMQSCKDDSFLQTPPPTPNQSFSEEFDTATAAFARGWRYVNNSFPLGSNVWQNGGALQPAFAPFSANGSFAGFIGASYLSTSAAEGIVSNWCISPSIIMQNGDKIIFFTRSEVVAGIPAADSTDWGNRLQVRINRFNDLTVGNLQKYYEWLFTPSPTVADDDPGNFTITLLDINRDQFVWRKNATAANNTKAYPVRWTRFEAIVSGLDGPTRGRFAFRYFVTGAGSNGLGTTVGIDKMEYKSVGY